MTTDKAASDISYNSTSGSVEVLLLGSWGSSSYLYDSANPPTRGWAKLVYDLGWNLTYQHGWDGLNTVGYSNLNNYQIIIDQRQSLQMWKIMVLIIQVNWSAFESWMATYGQNTCGSRAGRRYRLLLQQVKQSLLVLVGKIITFTGKWNGDVASTFAEEFLLWTEWFDYMIQCNRRIYITSILTGNCFGVQVRIIAHRLYRAQDLEALLTVADFFTWQ